MFQKIQIEEKLHVLYNTINGFPFDFFLLLLKGNAGSSLSTESFRSAVQNAAIVRHVWQNKCIKY